MMSTWSIRVARAGDAPRICEIHVQAIHTLCASHYRPREIAAWVAGRRPEEYREAIEEGYERLYVLEIAGEVAGFSALTARELRALYVEPAQGGRGLGSGLLGFTEDEARRHGTRTLYLDASLNAVPFYRRHGYEMLGGSHVTLEDGTRLPALRMRKGLVVSATMVRPAIKRGAG